MFEGLSPSGLLTEVEQSRCDESVAMARRMAAIARLLWHRTAEAEGIDDDDPSYALITGFARTCAEVGAAMNVAPLAASKLVAHAEALDTRLPEIFTLLASGYLDWDTAKTIIVRTELVDAELMPRIDEALAEKIAGWECWSRSRLVNAVDAAIRRADPEAAKKRRIKADTDRNIGVTAMPNGMARVHGVVPAHVAALFTKRLTDIATGVCPSDPRTLIQRRVDAVEVLGEGRTALACTCGRPDCPIEPVDAAPGPARFVVNVIASADTLTGRSDAPGHLEGYGVIDADQVRNLADNALLRPTGPPAPDVAAALEYQPPAAVARWIRCRDLTCRFPGCNRPAWRADIDHTTPFDHHTPHAGGLTVPGNLSCYCRQHHRLKTFLSGRGGWQDTQLADGTIEWTSPTGRVYRSTPDGAELFGDIQAACNTPAPRRRNHRRDKSRRTALVRAGMQLKRTANAETLRVNQARAHEIEIRKWRNDVRRKHLVFNGGQPSTSPWCRWVDDSPEDEHITAGWRPPPPKPTADDDAPPF